MKDKALVTFGTGAMEELLEIAMPSFEVFAERHGYEIIVFEPEPHEFWPPAWMKVSCIQDALEDNEEVLWVDADVVITDPEFDVPCPRNAWQSIVAHKTPDGLVPNTGVWLCRRPMEPYLESMWQMQGYRNHPWWEQGALMELLGFDSWSRPTVFREQTRLHKQTYWMDNQWNSHPWDSAEHPRFRHATMLPDRAAAMREWANLARPDAVAGWVREDEPSPGRA